MRFRSWESVCVMFEANWASVCRGTETRLQTFDQALIVLNMTSRMYARRHLHSPQYQACMKTYMHSWLHDILYKDVCVNIQANTHAQTQGFHVCITQLSHLLVLWLGRRDIICRQRYMSAMHVQELTRLPDGQGHDWEVRGTSDLRYIHLYRLQFRVRGCKRRPATQGSVHQA